MLAELEKSNIPLDLETSGYLRFFEDNEDTNASRKVLNDGLLGHRWLGERIWIFDYHAELLTYLTLLKDPQGQKVPLSFKGPGLYYPRFSVEVDGQELQMLLDTGATSFFSQDMMKRQRTERAFQASSFIRESVFKAWRAKNPDWRVMEKADRMGNQPMMEVPKVKIAGKEIGPVWFAQRPDETYDKMMAEYMDCKCSGAVGGNILTQFKLTLDYPQKSAYFHFVGK